jgi:chemotaxis protein methyltransferase CheR
MALLTQDSQAMTLPEYKQLQQVIIDLCGIALGDDKQYLIETRLAKLLAENGCETYGQFAALCKTRMTPALKLKIIDAMTTRETLWFRDGHPFEMFKTELLPALVAQHKATGRPIRIWSAACSSGQEPYSLAMCIIEYANATGNRDLLNHIQIKATDIAPISITLSKLGRYDAIAMSRGLDEMRKARFFEQQGKSWAVKPEVKQLITFEPFNLQDDPARLGQFNLIFMRNVAIYFSKEFKTGLFARLATVLPPKGQLMLGSTESLVGLNTPFSPVRYGKTTVYQKP